MADLVNCCNGEAASDLTQSIVSAIDGIKEDAEKIRKFTNGGVTETVDLGGVPTNTLRKLVYDATNSLNGYVVQAKNSAASAHDSADSAYASAESAGESAAAAYDSASDARASKYAAADSAAEARASKNGAATSAANAQWYFEELEERARIESWVPWQVAIDACRATQSAITQAMGLYKAWYRDKLHLWRDAITATRNANSAIRQAMDIYKLYQGAAQSHDDGIVFVPTDGESSGGVGSYGGLIFVPD
jgi:hypothetical protein